MLFLQQGEISALINLARVLGGFSVAYFQVPWAEKHGALQTYGVEAACVTSVRHGHACLRTYFIPPELLLAYSSLSCPFCSLKVDFSAYVVCLVCDLQLTYPYYTHAGT